MTYVYVLVTPSGFILGVYANRDAAASAQELASGECRISQEPLIGEAA